ncbi:MAG: insulinase family protein [Coriobacteriales bacterium]|jgi:predicted Zn-dependent peptidase|nr:insulinase family protein [Coriobacteriales bacterium]
MFYETSQLNNGFDIVSERVQGVRSVTLGIWFRVGSRDELPEQSGISHFMEHMMFKGTEQRSALDISTAFDAMGAELNAFTSKEYTCYYARVLDEHLEQAVTILADMLKHSLFAQEAIDSERQVVIEEIARYEDTPDDHVGDIFTEAMFPRHQLGRSILGTREIVGSFAHSDCVAYHQKHYHAGNAVLTAAGNIEHAALVQLCEKHFSTVAPGQVNPRGCVEGGTRERLTFEQKDTEQAHLVYGMPGVALGEDDRYAARILDSTLGGPMSSRLFQEVREKRGLAYAIYAATVPYMNAAQFFIYCGTRPANLAEVYSLIRTETAKLLERGISTEELKRVKEYLIGTMVLAMESTRDRMIKLGSHAVQGLELLSLEETIDRYRAVEPTDIQRVAKRVLSAQPTIAVISPLGKKELSELFG